LKFGQGSSLLIAQESHLLTLEMTFYLFNITNQLNIGLWKNQLGKHYSFFSYSPSTKAIFGSFTEVTCNMPLLYLRFNCYFYEQF